MSTIGMLILIFTCFYKMFTKPNIYFWGFVVEGEVDRNDEEKYELMQYNAETDQYVY